MRIFEIARYKTSKSLLSCGVPQLKAIGLIFVDEIFDEKVDADGCLYEFARTLQDSSNLLLMNRSMIDVLPTCWSPSNTILYFVLPPTVELDKLITKHYQFWHNPTSKRHHPIHRNGNLTFNSHLIFCIIIMEEEQQAYRPIRTAKTFLQGVLAAFQKRDGERIAKQFKELYFTQNYDTVPEKSWTASVNSQSFADAEPTVGALFAKVVELSRDFAGEKAGGRWSEAFEKHMQTLVAVVKALQQLKDYREWVTKPLRTVVRATKRIFLAAQRNVVNSSAAAKLKNTLLNTLQRFKSARAILDEIKKEFLPLIDIMQVSILLSFHNYEQIQRILYSPKIYGEHPSRYIDNFRFQKGKYALVNENFKEAEEELSQIRLRTQGQKRLVLRYLIPCKLLLGRVFAPTNAAQRNDYAEYLAISEAMVRSDFRRYEQLSQKYQKVWLKRGIYLLMDRVRVLLWRNLVKRLALLVGNKVEMELIVKAVQQQGGQQDLNECVCIVGNLIYEGFIKGYIFQSQTKRTLVLKSSGAFPPIHTVAK